MINEVFKFILWFSNSEAIQAHVMCLCEMQVTWAAKQTLHHYMFSCLKNLEQGHIIRRLRFSVLIPDLKLHLFCGIWNKHSNFKAPCKERSDIDHVNKWVNTCKAIHKNSSLFHICSETTGDPGVAMATWIKPWVGWPKQLGGMLSTYILHVLVFNIGQWHWFIDLWHLHQQLRLFHLYCM